MPAQLHAERCHGHADEREGALTSLVRSNAAVALELLRRPSMGGGQRRRIPPKQPGDRAAEREGDREAPKSPVAAQTPARTSLAPAGTAWVIAQGTPRPPAAHPPTSRQARAHTPMCADEHAERRHGHCDEREGARTSLAHSRANAALNIIHRPRRGGRRRPKQPKEPKADKAALATCRNRRPYQGGPHHKEQLEVAAAAQRFAPRRAAAAPCRCPLRQARLANVPYEQRHAWST